MDVRIRNMNTAQTAKWMVATCCVLAKVIDDLEVATEEERQQRGYLLAIATLIERQSRFVGWRVKYKRQMSKLWWYSHTCHSKKEVREALRRARYTGIEEAKIVRIYGKKKNSDGVHYISANTPKPQRALKATSAEESQRNKDLLRLLRTIHIRIRQQDITSVFPASIISTLEGLVGE